MSRAANAVAYRSALVEVLGGECETCGTAFHGHKYYCVDCGSYFRTEEINPNLSDNAGQPVGWRPSYFEPTITFAERIFKTGDIQELRKAIAQCDASKIVDLLGSNPALWALINLKVK